MPESLSPDALKDIAEFINDDFRNRQGARKPLEEQWDEIDRQIEMCPKAPDVRSGEGQDWFPQIELPLQYNSLEVIAADARRLKFPRGTEWFSVLANLSDEFIERWDRRRTRFPIIGSDPAPMKLNQETADAMVKAVMDHYHRLYDFRASIDLFDAEMIKYGTGIVRVRPVELAAFRYDFRGVTNRNLIGPAVIPCPIRHTYLESGTALLHEGLCLAPSVIRWAEQLFVELKRAARIGGSDRGWMPGAVNALEPQIDKDRRELVELLEFEGDLVVPRTRTSIFMPNMLVTVAVGANGPRVIRMRENDMPYRSYVPGYYLRHDPLSPYGASPLMKGQPIQDGATQALNALVAVAALQGKPPVTWDAHDAGLQARGGPMIFPGAIWPSDAPDRIVVQSIGDLAGLTQVYLGLVKQYEDITGVNDPRRGAQIKSHTSATSHTIEAERGIARTDDFVQGQEMGSLRSILYLEWEIARKVLTKEMPVAMDAAGLRGYINLGAADLPDEATFFIHGSEGVVEERNKLQQFMLATQAVTQLVVPAMQMAQAGIGKPLIIDFEKLAHEFYERAGIQNAAGFIGPSTSGPPGIAGQPGIPPTVGGVPAAAPGTVPAGANGGGGTAMGVPVGGRGGGAPSNGVPGSAV